jgi:hypothetical protein
LRGSTFGDRADAPTIGSNRRLLFSSSTVIVPAGNWSNADERPRLIDQLRT